MAVEISSIPKHKDSTNLSSILMASVIASMEVSEKTYNSSEDEEKKKLKP